LARKKSLRQVEMAGKLYAIWSITTKGWVTSSLRGVSLQAPCTYKLNREAARAIKDDLVHEKDYEVREYVSG
jgi:hypothetical protein